TRSGCSTTTIPGPTPAPWRLAGRSTSSGSPRSGRGPAAPARREARRHRPDRLLPRTGSAVFELRARELPAGKEACAQQARDGVPGDGRAGRAGGTRLEPSRADRRLRPLAGLLPTGSPDPGRALTGLALP